MDDVEPLEHLHVKEHKDRFDDHEYEQDRRDDSDDPEVVELSGIEW